MGMRACRRRRVLVAVDDDENGAPNSRSRSKYWSDERNVMALEISLITQIFCIVHVGDDGH